MKASVQSEQIKERIIESYNSGDGCRTIGERTGLGYYEIRKSLAAWGIPIRPRGSIPEFIVNIGDRFGMLCVIGKQYRLKKPGNVSTETYVPCACDCGKNSDPNLMSLRTRTTSSCGCNMQAHKTTHGEAGTRLHRIWNGMRSRCSNENYKSYHGRGISVCPEWGDFEPFARWAKENGYRDDLSIDRINNDGNYEPQNCRWATRSQQSLNRSNNHYLTAFGETKQFSEWFKDPRCKLKYIQTLRTRLRNGWNIRDAISTPDRGERELERDARKKLAEKTSTLSPEEIASETWKLIPGFSEYDASSVGRLRSRRLPGLPPRVIYETGKNQVRIYNDDGNLQTTTRARLVLLAHVGLPPEPDMDACHFPDATKANCRLSNLRWDTRSENMKDKCRFTRLLTQEIDADAI